MKKLTFHPACLLFPQLPKDELKALAADIKANGLQNSIVLYEGQILDGRNRYLACKIAKVKPTFIEWKGQGSPVAWVISENLVRRHLTSSQRAVVALDILPLLEKEAKDRQGSRTSRKNLRNVGAENGEARQIAARLAKTNHTYVQALKAISKAAPELIAKVRNGDLSVPDAKRLSEIPKGKRSSYVFNGGSPVDPRPNTITTPPGICQFLHDLIAPCYKVKTILDPSAGAGALTKPWRGLKVITYEISKGRDFFRSPAHIDCDLVLCNPPFNNTDGETRFLPQLFLERIVKVVPKRTPIVLFTPMAMRLDQTTRSTRWRWLRDHCPSITGIVSLPHDAFGSVKVHSEILFFNMPRLSLHYFLPDKYLR